MRTKDPLPPLVQTRLDFLEEHNAALRIMVDERDRLLRKVMERNQRLQAVLKCYNITVP